MGQVTEYEEIMEDLEKLRQDTDGIVLASAGINRCTGITLTVRPLTFDVMINGEHVHSFNELENAKKVYDIIRSDYAGRVHHGK